MEIRQKKNIKKEYLQREIDPIVSKLLTALLSEMPADPLEFMIEYLSALKEARGKGGRAESDCGDDQVDDLQFQKQKSWKIQRSAQRGSVSAQAFGAYNKMERFTPPKVKKTEQQAEGIRKIAMNCFLLNVLERPDLETVVGAFRLVEFKEGEMVIREGEKGNQLYLVVEGKLDCSKRLEGGTEPTHLKYYRPGDFFGELALLYDCPRQASIRALKPCKLWALDRPTFNSIVRERALQKRDKHKRLLQKVEILKQMEEYERTRLAEVLQLQCFGKGATVISEGDIGNQFYIVEEGQLEARKRTSSGELKRVMEYGAGSYFGELALLREIPRQATIVCLTDCRLLRMDRETFKRLLGPIEYIMERDSAKYEPAK